MSGSHPSLATPTGRLVALRLAVDAPEIVSSLVLFDPSPLA
jgi:hypothetical protein